MLKILNQLFFLLIIGVIANPVTADIYKWVDDDGTVYYTDKPLDKKNPEKIKLQINSYTSPKVSPFSYDSSLISGYKTTEDVVMYSTTWCGYCKKAKRYFNQHNISFEEYDVEKSAKGKMDYKALRGRGVPIILVGNRRMNGFSESSFEKLYQQ